LSITIAPSKTVGQLKEEIASKSDVAKERQRLIYSGKSLILTPFDQLDLCSSYRKGIEG
jgi:hypothetical protein